MRIILARETSGRVSFASFVDHYLRIFDFPSDVQRSELLHSHLAVQGSQTRLRECVKELPGESKQPEVNLPRFSGHEVYAARLNNCCSYSTGLK